MSSIINNWWHQNAHNIRRTYPSPVYCSWLNKHTRRLLSKKDNLIFTVVINFRDTSIVELLSFSFKLDKFIHTDQLFKKELLCC